jgi:aspartyl-tRNA(Asn)/glutamyl-tRNA(Gln) amidotransferase subunit C
MSTRVDEQQTRAAAKLARLALSDAEIARYSAQLTAILNYVRDIQGLDTNGVEPFSHAPPRANALRADTPLPGLTAEQALANAPDVTHGCFHAPAVLPHENGG